MPRERSQDHAPGQHTKVSGNVWWTVTRVGAEKQPTKWDTGDRHGTGGSGMSPSYEATGASPASCVEMLSFKSNIRPDNIVGFNFGMDGFPPIPSYNPLSEGLVRFGL